MTNREKRIAVVEKVISREGKNTYTQGSKRTQVSNGYSDCSSLQQWAYKQILGIDIGDNTEAQMLSKNMSRVDLKIMNGIPDESKMLLGDLLYFRGTDTERKKTGYVGHVEMYVGNGQLSGHGSGTGPTRKNMVEYCKSRQNRIVDAPIYNRGLICVKRVIPIDGSDRTVPEILARKRITDLYLTVLGRMPDEAGLDGWVREYMSGTSFENIYNAFVYSDEGCKHYVSNLYLNLLGRIADTAGLNAWADVIANGKALSDVYSDFKSSDEYKSHNK